MNARPLLRSTARTGVQRAAWLAIAAMARLYRMFKPAVRAGGGPVDRILLIRLDLLGDVLFSLNAAAGLKRAYPDARVTMLTLPYTAPLAGLSPDVDEVIAVDTNLIRRARTLFSVVTWLGYVRTLRALRRRPFDLTISLSGPMASLWAFLSGARRTIGYAGEQYPGLLTDPVPGRRYAERAHEVEYVARLASTAGALSIPSHLEIPTEPAARTHIQSKLRTLGIGERDILVVIHAGSVNGSAKRWPSGHWARFASELARRAGAKVVLAGARTDLPIAVEVMSGSPGVRSLVGDTSVAELIALLDRADLVATGDSGPLHLAVARGRPLLAVYGPTDPAIHGPYHPTGPVRVNRVDLPCSPCYTMAASAECPLGDPICMRLVSVDRMVRDALELLDPGAVARESDAMESN